MAREKQQIKACTICKVPKDRSEFYNYKNGCVSSRCIPCSRVYATNRNKAGLTDRLPLLEEFRKDGCLVCGEKHPSCLAAHHKDPTKKEYSIASMVYNAFKIPQIKAELAKCLCLCFNCHQKFHAGAIALPIS